MEGQYSYFHSLFSSVAQSCPTLCDSMHCSIPGFPVLHQSLNLLKLMSVESVMPSNQLVLCPLLHSIFPSIRVFSNEPALSIRWPKYWSFSFSLCPSNEYSGLISFSIDWFDLLAGCSEAGQRPGFEYKGFIWEVIPESKSQVRKYERAE